jgi:hypothetical protein
VNQDLAAAVEPRASRPTPSRKRGAGVNRSSDSSRAEGFKANAIEKKRSRVNRWSAFCVIDFESTVIWYVMD